MADDEHHNWLVRLISEIGDALVWMARQIADPEVRAAVYADLGLKAPSASDPAFPDLTPHLDSIDAYRKAANPDAEQLKAVVEDLRAIRQAIRDWVHVTQGNPSGELATQVEAMLDSVFGLMTINYLRLRYPGFYWVGQILHVAEDALSTGVLPQEVTAGAAIAAKAIWGNIVKFFSNPYDYFASLSWPPLNSKDDALLQSHVIFPAAALGISRLTKWLAGKNVLSKRDVTVLYGWEPDPQSTTPLGDEISERTLAFSIGSTKPGVTDPLQGSVACALALVPKDHGGPGLFVSLGGSAALEWVVNQWKWKSKFSVASGVSMIITGWDSGRALSGAADQGFEFSVEHVPPPPPAPGDTPAANLPQVIDIGPAGVEIGDVKFTVSLSPAGPAMLLTAYKSAFFLDTQSDAVVARGTDGNTERMRLELDLGIGYRAGKFYFDGGNGLEVTLPAAKTLGPLQARGLTIALKPGSDQTQPPATLEAAATVIFKLGCVTITVDRIGLTLALGGDNFPDADIKHPNGVGIAIQTEGASGSGYLFYDHTNHQYAGVFELTIKDRISVKAIGIINTVVEGKPGFSFLIILTVSGFSWDIGYGFKITGLGGLFGFDRELNFTALEAGVKTHALDSLMFPHDPAANSAQIVTDAAKAFPPKRGQAVAGAMVQLSWGTDKLVRLEIAVIVQLPSFNRLVILGKARVFAPTEDKPIVKIAIDLIGDFDFDRKRAFAQAILTESKLATFTLSGQAAMLVYWGTNGTFLLSFGGFNARFQALVPSEFPTLPRIAISIKKSDTLRAEMTLYQAFTSHSIQLGGSLALFAKSGKFSIEGSISVDALLQRDEPTVNFDLKAKLELKAWDVTLFMISLEGSLAGTEPWHVKVKFTFEIFIFSHTFNYENTWGDSTTAVVVQMVDVASTFMAALADGRNWNAELPPAFQSLVTLRPEARAQLLLHPLGTISMVQRVVPLGVPITRFGNSVVQGQNLFQIDSVMVAGTAVTVDKLQEAFVRSQFLDMTEDEKLSTPAYEAMDAGVRVPAGVLDHGRTAAANTQYRTLIYNADTGTAEPDAPYTMQAGLLSALVQVGAAARAMNARGGSLRYRGPARPVRVAPLGFVIASSDSMAAAAAPGLGGTSNFTTAATTLRSYLKANPAQRGNLQVLPMAG
jgi:hypothetical protein